MKESRFFNNDVDPLSIPENAYAELTPGVSENQTSGRQVTFVDGRCRPVNILVSGQGWTRTSNLRSLRPVLHFDDLAIIKVPCGPVKLPAQNKSMGPDLNRRPPAVTNDSTLAGAVEANS